MDRYICTVGDVPDGSTLYMHGLQYVKVSSGWYCKLRRTNPKYGRVSVPHYRVCVCYTLENPTTSESVESARG